MSPFWAVAYGDNVAAWLEPPFPVTKEERTRVRTGISETGREYSDGRYKKPGNSKESLKVWLHCFLMTF
jgi:hypothetical protein